MHKGKKSLLVFGAGPLQCSIINVARENGFFVVAIDPDSNAVGKGLADVFVVVGGQDFEATISVAKEYAVDGIVTAATDKPLLMMARIAEALSFSFPSFDAIERTIDKALFKTALEECGLPCAKGKLISEKSELSSFPFPSVLKPKDSSGSRGVIICNSLAEAEAAFEETLNSTNSDSILVEEFLAGDEISVECLVYGGKVTIIQMTDKVITPPPYNVELSQIQPSVYTERFKDKIQTMLQRIVDHLGLDNCPLHPEFKIDGDKISFVEMGPRLGGDYITSHLTPLSTGCNIELELINIATGKTPDMTVSVDGASAVKYFELPVYKKVLDVDRYSLGELGKELHNLDLNLYPGKIIQPITDSLNRYGSFIVSGSERKDLEMKIREVGNMVLKSISVGDLSTSEVVNRIMYDFETVDRREVHLLLSKLSNKLIRWLAVNHPDNRTRRDLFRFTNVTVGEDSVINFNCYISDDYKKLVTIGDRVAVAPNVTIVAVSGPNFSKLKDHPTLLEHAITEAPVVIEDDVWIGSNSIILPGVTIGEGSVIGAGAVVVDDIPPKTVAVGAPCKVVKQL